MPISVSAVAGYSIVLACAGAAHGMSRALPSMSELIHPWHLLSEHPMKSNQSPKPFAKQAPAMDPSIMELMKPGPEHALLAKYVGTWDVSFTHWMQKDAEPEKAEGKAVFSSVFDGRYIREEFTSEFHGKPFLGVGILGFNRLENRFVLTWYDNAGTGILYTTGTPSTNGRDMTFQGTQSMPKKQGPTMVRHVYSMESDDRFTTTVFSEDKGNEWKGMEIIYVRIK